MAEEKTSLLVRFGDWWKDYFQVLARSFARMNRDNVNIMASGLVYSTLIAIVPGITFLFAFLSAFGVLQPFVDMLRQFLLHTLGDDNGSALMVMLEEFSRNAMSLGVVGLVSFIVTGIFLINKIYTVMNRIYRTNPRNNAVKRFVTFLTFIIVAAFLIMVIISLQTRLTRIAESLITEDNDAAGSWWEPIVIAVASEALLFSFIFFIPNVRVRKTSAFIGSMTGTVSVLIATFIFSQAVTGMVNFSVIYGSLASILLALLYCYIVWYIIMVSAEIAYVHQFRPNSDLLKGRPESPESQITESVNLVLLICDKYTRGQGAMTEKELIRRLAIPSSRLYGYLNTLENAGMIMPVNVHRTAFVPARPSDKILVRDVVGLVYGERNSSDSRVMTMGEAVSGEFRDRGLGSFESLTIENLMERL